MKTRWLLLLIFLAAAPLSPAENEIGFIEKFALAADREAVLQQLVPGTEDYYFFHALHYQNSKQAAKFAAIMEQWAKRFKDSARRRIIENRAALLAYDANPQQTLTFLRERLNLEFNHVQETRDQKPDLPAVLDQARIARSEFLKVALQRDDLGSCGEETLQQLVRDKAPLNPVQRRALLSRLTRPDVPGLVELIAEELKSRDTDRPFGGFMIEKALLPEQLDALAKLVPRILNETEFVYAKLRKLAPSADADVEFDPAAREAWLDRLWAYAKPLPPAFNSLKAHILHARLYHDRKRGIHDEARFREYLTLPRQANYMNPRWLERPRNEGVLADLNADFAEARLGLPPIRSDEELVRAYFLHIFVKAEAWEPWATLVRDTWLKPVFAEAKIVNGIGDAEKWASLLAPAAFQRLKERVDIEFPASNPAFIAPADDVTFAVTLKNTPKLIVKIYEINTLNFFLTQKRALNTDLNLDGLVANTEQTHDGEASPFRRVTRAFAFPELRGRRGAWVIEFIGGGKSSRALIRKGQLKVLQQSGPAGDLLTVLDEANAPVADAAVWSDGRKFTAQSAGGAPAERLPAVGAAALLPEPRILVPFTAQPGRKQIVLATADGAFASLAEFEHHGEEYRLDAQFHLEREQLLARREATLGMRAALLLGDAQVALELLQDVKLVITSTTLDGIATTTEVQAPKLAATQVFTHKFSVPERLETLTVTLSAKIETLSKGGEKQDLSASHSWNVNGIDKTEATNDGHLSKFGDDYVFELLGKNGEPLADRQIIFQLRRLGFQEPLTLPLRTDDNGRVMLGKLAEITTVGSESPSGREGSWELDRFERTWPTTLHLKAGEKIALPWAAELKAGSYSLLEMRGGEFVADRSAVAFSNPLEPGDYWLRIRDEDGESHAITIRVAAGQPVQNWLLGPHRSLEIRDAKPLHISSVQVTDAGVAIKLVNANPFTRVHLAATRFLPDRGIFGGLAGFTRFAPTFGTPDKLPNLFSSGREIGDEYRYIIERRYSTKYPGNMLTRPGLLLNPWEKRKTDNEALAQSGGQAAGNTRGGRAGNAPKSPAEMPSPQIPQDFGATKTTNFDFLADAAPVLWNLVPDKDGLVVVPRRLLGDRQFIQVYAEDLTNAVWRTLALPEVPTKFTDLRLTRNLDPAKTFTERRQTTVLATGGTLKIDDLLTSEMESYDTLAGVHALFTTLSGRSAGASGDSPGGRSAGAPPAGSTSAGASPAESLAQFAWLLQWPVLKDEEKRAKYSEFACHELNFFLSRKDPAFFEKVVQPYLRNKKDRTFMDDFLVGADLRTYLEPWRFGRLNVVERALLATRIPGEGAHTARHLRELWELLPPNAEEDDRIFETALRGRAMEDLPEAETASPESPVDAVAAKPAQVGRMFAKAKKAAGPREEQPVPEAPALAAMSVAGVALDSADRERVAEKLSKLEEARRDGGLVALKNKDGEVVGRGAFWNDDESAKLNINAASDGVFWDSEAVLAQRVRAQQQAFYRRLGPTREWAENHYWHLPIEQQNAELITINAFWKDFAAWVAEGSKAPFLSPHVAQASRNFSEMMFALAVLDLPFDPAEHTTKTEGATFTLLAAGPMIIFHKEIKPADQAPAGAGGGLLISENFFRDGDRYRQEGNEKFDKFVTGEFVAGVVYGAHVVVTNPNSAPAKLDLLTQIPRGALPVRGSKATASRYVRLEPYTTQQLEYYFYFPAPGAQPFPHFPVNVALDGRSAAAAKASTFNVVKQLSEIDKASWDYVSQAGSDADVFAFFEQHNLERLNLERVAWRARTNVDFFRKLVALLARRHVWSEPIYRYAVAHNDPGALREWLRRRDDFLAQCGPWLDSTAVRIDPTERRAYEHLEYSPLVNQRAHRLGSEHRIANSVLLAQYQRLLDILAHKPALDAADQMSVTYHLFLQDRVEEALARFRGIKADALPTRVQHDYFRCYAALYEEKLADARGVAASYADYPVDRWRARFAEVTAQLNEIEKSSAGAPPAGSRSAGAPPAEGRENQQTELAQTQPSFDFKVENRAIALTWKNLPEVTVNYYLMDPEFLFSSSPFVSADPGRFAIIKATKTAKVSLPADKDALDVPLPAEFAKANVLVEILGTGQRKAQPYYANTLKLTIAEQYGRLEARDSATDKPVSKAYVKVYARLKSGGIRFLKDGYTDLRGKFDYASINSPEAASPTPPRPLPAGHSASGNLDAPTLQPAELDAIARVSILLLSDAHGAALREAEPPRE